MKKEALRLIENLTYCVISTVSIQNRSESALVGFSAGENFEIMIGTSKKSRKFQNILTNPHVSVVFGPYYNKAVQLEGLARPLKGAELAKRKEIHFKKSPSAQKYEDDPEQTYIVIEPKWLRVVESGPRVIGETRQFS